MDIVYSATRGHNSEEVEKLVSQQLPSYLQSLGHQVSVFVYDPSEPQDTEPFDELVEKILQADMFVAEMSRASQTLGFQLSFVLVVFCVFRFLHVFLLFLLIRLVCLLRFCQLCLIFV